MMRTRLKTLLALSGTMIALTACGGGDDDGAADPSPTEVETSATTPPDGTADPADTTQPPTTTSQAADPRPTSTTATSPPTTTGPGSPATTEAAAARLQRWLRAYGSGDAATYCEIAGPLFERIGLPRDDCLEMFSTFRNEPAEELASMAKANVDASQATEVAPGTVEIPDAAIELPTPISDPPRPDGIYVMTHDGNVWYLTDAPEE